MTPAKRVAMAVCLVALLVFPRKATAQFTVVDLGTLGGGTSEASAVNQHGQVVGSSAVEGDLYRAFSWTAAAGMVDLGALEDEWASTAIAVNDRGQVLVQSYNPGVGFTRGFVWTSSGGAVD